MDARRRASARRLVAFIPELERYGPGLPFEDPASPRATFAPDADGVYHMTGGPTYPPLLHSFVRELEDGGWLDGAYDQSEGLRYRERQDLLRDADADTLRRLLLWCQRSDYWTGTGWKDAVESGFLVAILQRLDACTRSS